MSPGALRHDEKTVHGKERAAVGFGRIRGLHALAIVIFECAALGFLQAREELPQPAALDELRHRIVALQYLHVLAVPDIQRGASCIEEPPIVPRVGDRLTTQVRLELRAPRSPLDRVVKAGM